MFRRIINKIHKWTKPKVDNPDVVLGNLLEDIKLLREYRMLNYSIYKNRIKKMDELIDTLERLVKNKEYDEQINDWNKIWYILKGTKTTGTNLSTW